MIGLFRAIFNVIFIWVVTIHTLIILGLLDGFIPWEWWAWASTLLMFVFINWEDK